MATTIQKRIKFSKGEINPLLSERTDIDLLDNGASYIKNYHQTIFGGLKTRLGTKRVDAIRNIVNQIETPTVEILFKNKIEDTTTLFKITAINKDNRFINFKINNIHFDKHKETKLEYEFETFEEEEHYEETNEEGETIDKIRVNTYYRLKTINILEAGNNYSIEPNIYFTNNTDNNDIIPQLKATISNRTLTSIEIFNSGKLTSIDNIKLTIEQPEEFNTTLNIIDNNNEILNTFTITEEPQDINITLAERQDKIIIERINNLYFDTTLLLDNFNFNVNKPIITSNIGGNLNNCLKKFESDAIGTKTGELLNIKFDAPVNYINFKINIRKSRKCILDTYCGMSVYKNGRYNIIFGNDKEDFMLLYRNSSSGNVIIVDKGYGYKDGIYDLIITKNVFPYERWESEPRAKAVVKNNEVVEIIDRHGYILNEPKSMIYSQKNYSLACNLPLADELLNQKLSIELQGKNNNEWETIESYLLTGDYIFINPVSLIGYNEFRIVRTGNNDLTTRLIIEDFNYGTVGNFSKDAVAIPFSNNKENYLLLICEGFILIYKNEILNNTIQVNEIKREHLENLKYTQMGNNIILTEGNLHPLILTLDNNNNWSIRKINIKFIPYYQFNKNDETLINNVILTPSATEGAIYLISNIDFFTKDLEGQIIDAGVGNGNNGGRFKIIKFENSKKVYSKTIIPFYEKTSFTNFTLIKGFEPVWSEIRGYPNACLYYQERLWFGGTGLVPLGLWGSRTGQYNDFNNIGNYDNDGIDIELSSKLQGEIVDLYGNRGLQIFTTEAEFVAGDNNLTPNTIAISQVSSIGSRRNTGVFDLSGITLFVDKKGLNLNTFVYDFSQDSYCSKVLTLLNNTPIKNPKRLAVDYNSNFENGNYIYLVNEDGTMAVINVLLDENINSMTRFETLNGEVKDCISFNNKTYLIVERNEGLFLEVMDNVKTDFTVEVGAVNGIITGLQYYNKVRVYNNQKDYGTFEVIDGTIDLQNTNINETLNIGLDIACRIISNDIIINNQTNNIKSRIAKVIITTTPETNEIIFNNHKHKPSRKEYEDNIFELYGVSNYETKNRFEIKSIFNQLEIKSILLYINYGR